MTIKKMYVDLVNLLEENADKKIKTVLSQVYELTSAKTTREAGATFLKDAEGNTVAIKCYYYKRWMPLVGPDSVEFGSKKSTATGYNTMCKEGVSLWTKQNGLLKKGHSSLLDRLEAGEITVNDLASEKQKIEDARKHIESTDKGFDSKEDLLSYLQDNNITVAE
jgi:hypothetical protein